MLHFLLLLCVDRSFVREQIWTYARKQNFLQVLVITCVQNMTFSLVEFSALIVWRR